MSLYFCCHVIFNTTSYCYKYTYFIKLSDYIFQCDIVFIIAGDEIGDMCSATYGYINQDPTTGVNYNLVLGSDKFMVQTIWQAPGTSHCALNSTAVPLVFASVSASPSQDTAVGFNFSTLSTPTLIGVCAGISVGGLALIVSVVYLLFRYRICCSSASWRVSSDKVVLSGKAKVTNIIHFYFYYRLFSCFYSSSILCQICFFNARLPL